MGFILCSVSQGKKRKVRNRSVQYAKKYCHCLFSGDLSEIAMLNVPKRRMVMASLSNLAKFLGVYCQWKKMIQRFRIKWITRDTTDKDN